MSSIVFEESVRMAKEYIFQEKIILYPTDTVWGIGCDATKEICIQKIFNIKNRPLYKSVILLVSDVEQLHKYVKVNSFMLDFLCQQTKPTTVIYPTTKIPLANSVYAADGSVAIRVVQHQFCKELIKTIKFPLVSTSA
ncbi:MAG: L-threonylcarbamoyladenylate synthase, partial [Chitinophagaceae bacterium]